MHPVRLFITTKNHQALYSIVQCYQNANRSKKRRNEAGPARQTEKKKTWALQHIPLKGNIPALDRHNPADQDELGV